MWVSVGTVFFAANYENDDNNFFFFFLDMRKIGSSRGAVTAYPRQLESLIRLAEAHAKMRFSVTVEIVDVEEAKRCKMSSQH